MVIIFDLDDTLYAERTYVEGGFRAVSSIGESRFGWRGDASFAFMMRVLEEEGRGRIFDRWIEQNGILSKKLVRECLHLYRHHTPAISLSHETRCLLQDLAEYPKYIVTDGHKVVQEKKVHALGLPPLFRHIYLTHRYGIRNSKPSIHCFSLIREREQCNWEDMVYVGDNPLKDFVNLTLLGVHTVRVLTGAYRDAVAESDHEARYILPDLIGFRQLLRRIESWVKPMSASPVAVLG